MIEVEKTVDEFGDVMYYRKGTKILHREDGPSIERADGTKGWYLDGKEVTEEEVMCGIKKVVFDDGDIHYYKRGTEIFHREDGPAAIYADGDKFWFINDVLHREDGPAVEYDDGHKEWLINGMLHREDGPAVEFANGSKRWYLNDQRHREDGPAIEYPNGTKEWYLNGNKVTEEDVMGEDLEAKAREIAEVLIPAIVKILEK